jgi:hypothetical protein
MALPVIGATFGGVIIGALTAFFATKIPVILATLGLSITIYSGLDIFVGNIITAVQNSISASGSITVGSHTVDALGILATAGVFDAVNIVLSGYISVSVQPIHLCGGGS